MKKVMPFIIICSLVIGFSSIAHAEDSNLIKQNEINKKYNLKKISVEELPEGVVPIKFDNFDDMDRYLQKVSSVDSKISIYQPLKNINFLDDFNYTLFGSSFDGYKTGRSINKATKRVGFATFNMKLDYDVYSYFDTVPQ